MYWKPIILLSILAFANGYDKVKSRLVMDMQVEKNLKKLPRLIEEAVETTEKENLKTAKTNAGFGWSIIGGSVGDSISVLQLNPDKFWNELYNLGFIGSYGIGFGYPYLTAQAMPSSKLSCGLKDYYSVLEDFNILDGPKDLLEILNNKEDVKSILKEAEHALDIRMKCLDPDQNIQNFRVHEALKLLMLAMDIRVDVD